PSHASVPKLRLVAWELTKSCVLSCKHCRASAIKEKYTNELSTSECVAIIDSIASSGKCIVILTGGEPMLRDDIYHLARYGTEKGLRMVMATCGTLLNKENCLSLIDSGIA